MACLPHIYSNSLELVRYGHWATGHCHLTTLPLCDNWYQMLTVSHKHTEYRALVSNTKGKGNTRTVALRIGVSLWMTYKHKSHETLWLSSLLIWIILCCTFEPRPEQDALNMMQGVSEREILRQVLGKKRRLLCTFCFVYLTHIVTFQYHIVHLNYFFLRGTNMNKILYLIALFLLGDYAQVFRTNVFFPGTSESFIHFYNWLISWTRSIL